MGIDESIDELFNSAEFCAINNIGQLLERVLDENYRSERLLLLKAYARRLYSKKIISEEDWRKFQDCYSERVEKENTKTKTAILGDREQVLEKIEKLDRETQSSGYRVIQKTGGKQ